MNTYSIKSNLQKLRYYAIGLQKRRSSLSLEEINSIKQKIKVLWQQVSRAIGSKQVRQCLGAGLVASLMVTTHQINAQNFADPVLKYDIEFNGVLIPDLGDIDQDGDLDIMGIGVDYDNNTNTYGPPDVMFGFQENIGDAKNAEFTIPKFGVFGLDDPNVIEENYAFYWELADVDNDGDIDLNGFGLDYSGDTYEGILVYLENIGSASDPKFGDYKTANLDLQNYLTREHTLIDFDGDGDLDILVLGGGYEYNGTDEIYFFDVLYFENIGDETEMDLAEMVVNPSNFNRLENPEGFEDAAYYFSTLDMADFDGDGDLDAVLVVNSYDSYYGSKFMYAENTGSEFADWTEIVNIALVPTELDDHFILNTIGDLDGDGDVDLFYSLAGEGVDDDARTNTYFVENLLIVSSTDEALEDAPATLYPTVTSSMVTVVFDEVNTQPISILSADGRMVKQFKGNNWQGEHAFDMSDLVIGQYYLRIVTKDQIHNLPFIRN